MVVLLPLLLAIVLVCVPGEREDNKHFSDVHRLVALREDNEQVEVEEEGEEVEGNCEG